MSACRQALPSSSTSIVGSSVPPGLLFVVVVDGAVLEGPEPAELFSGISSLSEGFSPLEFSLPSFPLLVPPEFLPEPRLVLEGAFVDRDGFPPVLSLAVGAAVTAEG